MIVKKTNELKKLIYIMTYFVGCLIVVSFYFVFMSLFSELSVLKVIFSFFLALSLGGVFIYFRKKIFKFVVKKISKMEIYVKDEEKRYVDKVIKDVTKKNRQTKF